MPGTEDLCWAATHRDKPGQSQGHAYPCDYRSRDEQSEYSKGRMVHRIITLTEIVNMNWKERYPYKGHFSCACKGKEIFSHSFRTIWRAPTLSDTSEYTYEPDMTSDFHLWGAHVGEGGKPGINKQGLYNPEASEKGPMYKMLHEHKRRWRFPVSRGSDGIDWGGEWEKRRIKQGFTEDWEGHLSEVLRGELNFSGEQGRTKHWK